MNYVWDLGNWGLWFVWDLEIRNSDLLSGFAAELKSKVKSQKSKMKIKSQTIGPMGPMGPIGLI